ncbi:MAG: SIMPL domain-containing protein [Clostridiales bacterium]|nr:SIMPL domain-containing protein [Clostridiales bacterium]
MEQKVITVTKTATEQVAANRVRISITVYGESKKYAAAVENANDATVAVLRAFDGMDGVALKNRGINVTAMRDDKKTVGYRAAQALSAEFDFVPSVFGKATEALSGLNVEWRVSFTFKDNGEGKELLKRAVAEAKADAENIATAAGVKLGGLIKAEYAATDGARPMMLRAAAFADNSVEPEEITLNETVTCTWQIA